MSGLVAADSYWARLHGRRETRGFISERLTCAGCGDPLPVQPHQGNPRKWCSETCRVRAARIARKTTPESGRK